MTYELAFLPSAQKEWSKLDGSIKKQFVKKLRERLENPHVPAAALHNMPDYYKIKLRQAGYRLIYQVEDKIVTVTVVAVGKRENNEAYLSAHTRLKS